MASVATERAFRLIEELRLSHKVIPGDDGSPYLLRTNLTPDADWWRTELALPGLFPHYFFRSDADRELHNHPWRRAVSLILAGGYWEERWDPTTRRIHKRLFRPGMVNYIRSDTFHRIQLVDEEQGCWTLFVAGKKVIPQGEWGFINRDGTWKETWNEREARLKKARNLNGSGS